MTKQPIIVTASGFWQRFKGLMWTRPLPMGQALLIPRCSCVHTFFMRYALDLVYLDERSAVVRLAHNVRPWRLSWGGRGARQTLEMTAGGIDRHAVQIGDVFVTAPAKEECNAHPEH